MRRSTGAGGCNNTQLDRLSDDTFHFLRPGVEENPEQEQVVKMHCFVG